MHVILDIWNQCCNVVREDGDPVFRDGSWGSADSRLLYHVRNGLRRQGLDVIKKLMWKDGHLVDSSQHYLRTRGPRRRLSNLGGSMRFVIAGNHLIRYSDVLALRESGGTHTVYFNRGGVVCTQGAYIPLLSPFLKFPVADGYVFIPRDKFDRAEAIPDEKKSIVHAGAVAFICDVDLKAVAAQVMENT